MKIVIINGSPRKIGATATILNELYDNLIRHTDLEVEMINLSDLQLNFCIGCCSCYTTGKCVFQDEIEALSLKIKNADGIILGSPTYASNVSAQMKLLIDRGHFVIEQLLQGKYALSVATYENYGGRDTLKILNKLMLFSGARISGTILAKTDFNSNPLNNIALKREIAKKAERIYQNINKQHKFPVQRLIHYLIFNIGIKPFVIKKGNKYRSVINHWNNN